MEHVVFYPSAEGDQAFKRVDSLDAAVSYVEHLRNSENITQFTVHSLTPVPLALRAYYHVEVPADSADGERRRRTDEPADAADDDRSAEWVAEAEIVEPSAQELAGSNDEPAEPTPFADAPPVEAQADAEPVNADVIPSGRRSMGFFAR